MGWVEHRHGGRVLLGLAPAGGSVQHQLGQERELNAIPALRTGDSDFDAPIASFVIRVDGARPRGVIMRGENMSPIIPAHDTRSIQTRLTIA